MQFKVGDTVRFLREVGSGKILEINNKSAIIEDENGFEMEYPLQLLVAGMQVSDDKLLGNANEQLKIKSASKGNNFAQKKPKEKEWKIDLHMENLVDSQRNMTNFEILTLQLNHLKKFIKKAEEAKIAKIIIVHGVGTGKLKREIAQLVKEMNGAEFFDADYAQYGHGASVLERKYNIR